MKKLTTGWRYLKEHSRLRRFFYYRTLPGLNRWVNY